MQYSPESTLRKAREQYFEAAGFGEDSYQARWIRFNLGPIPVALLNTQARVRAARLHDLHHVLTEYDTSLAGEAEIGAWELASGCGAHYAAWILNFQAMGIGVLMDLPRIREAFLRGCQQGNLYGGQFRDEYLDKLVGDMRRDLGIRFEKPQVNRTVLAKFYFFAFLGISSLAIPVLGILLFLAFLTYLLF